MRDEILERMRKYIIERTDGDEILSDVNNKRMIDMESVQKNPDVFKQFMLDIKAWSDESHRGLICGIFGCTNPPDMLCKICECSYCDRCKEFHFHSAKHDGLIDSEVFDK